MRVKDPRHRYPRLQRRTSALVGVLNKELSAPALEIEVGAYSGTGKYLYLTHANISRFVLISIATINKGLAALRREVCENTYGWEWYADYEQALINYANPDYEPRPKIPRQAKSSDEIPF